METSVKRGTKKSLVNRRKEKDAEQKLLEAAIVEADLWAQRLTEDIQLDDVDSKIEDLENELFNDNKKKRKRKSKSGKKAILESPEDEVAEGTAGGPLVLTGDEEWNEPVAFTFDLGRLDAEMNRLVELLEAYPGEPGRDKPTPESATARSLFTATSDTLERLGLKVILNRIGLLLKYKNEAIQLNSDINERSRDISTLIENRLRGISMLDGLNLLLRRSDHIFAKELGHISGSVIVYPEHLIMMMEGPEIALVDFFTQLYKTSLMKRILIGKVMFIMPHVLVRYLKDWVAVIATPETIARDEDLSTEEEKTSLAMLGVKCRKLWRHIRKATQANKPVESLVDGIIPEISLLELALNSSLLRPFDTWLTELINISYESSPFDDMWPDKGQLLPLNIQKEDPYIMSPRNDYQYSKEKDAEDKSSKNIPSELSRFLANENLPLKTFSKEGSITEHEIPERDPPYRKAPLLDKMRKEMQRKALSPEKDATAKGKPQIISSVKDSKIKGISEGTTFKSISRQIEAQKDTRQKEKMVKKIVEKFAVHYDEPQKDTEKGIVQKDLSEKVLSLTPPKTTAPKEESFKKTANKMRSIKTILHKEEKVISSKEETSDMIPSKEESKEDTNKTPSKVTPQKSASKDEGGEKEEVETEALKTFRQAGAPLKTVIMWGAKVREMPKVELKKKDTLDNDKVFKHEQEQSAARKEREMRIKKRFEKSLMISKLISGKKDPLKK